MSQRATARPMLQPTPPALATDAAPADAAAADAAPAEAAFAYARAAPDPAFSRGAPVLRWASAAICADKALVRFLVWSNPGNLGFASPALQADPEVVRTALFSPYYGQAQPDPGFCVLRYAAPGLRDDRSLVLDAVAVNAYELQFAGEALRADPHVVAWAGAPRGSQKAFSYPRELVRFVRSLPPPGLSPAHVETRASEVFRIFIEHVQFNAFGGRSVDMAQTWQQFNAEQKESWCAALHKSLAKKTPLLFSVSPAVRDVLWPV